MVTIGTWRLWLVFSILISIAIAVDLFVLGGKKDHKVTAKEASRWISMWISLALLFNFGLWTYLFYTQDLALANKKAAEFFTGYLIEFSLSVDNLFVFLLIFKTFGVPPALQRRALIFGILGAIFMRLIFILVGVWLVSQFHWILYVFGAFLIYTGFKILFLQEKEPDLSKNLIVVWMSKHLRMTKDFEGEHFLVKKKGQLYVTPLFAVLVLIASCDLMFAIDSIPAIFAITDDPFIIFTSNVFAVLGLRAMYFLLARMAELFHLLKHGVGLILVFIGIKMVLTDWIKMPVTVTLGVIIVILTGCVVLSLIYDEEGKRRKKAKK